MMPDPAPVRAGARTFAGLFLVTLATLTYQLLLTRIFSVTMYYHFAFVAISVTMFGMAVGALLVYGRPAVFASDRLPVRLSQASLGFAITIVASFLAHLWLPFRPELSLAGVATVVVTYAVLSIPFTFSGIVVALALTRFPQQVSALYATDLAGAAVGCALLGPLLRVTDAPTGIVATAAVAGLGAVLFLDQSLVASAFRRKSGDNRSLPAKAGSHEPRRGLRRICLAVTLLFATFAVVHTYAVRHDSAWLRLVWVKGRCEPRPNVVSWNSFSS